MTLEAIAKALGFEVEDVRMIVEAFQEDATLQMQHLEKAIETHAFEAIVEASHAIKGSAANLQLEVIASLAKELEAHAREQAPFEYQHTYSKLALELEALAH